MKANHNSLLVILAIAFVLSLLLNVYFISFNSESLSSSISSSQVFLQSWLVNEKKSIESMYNSTSSTFLDEYFFSNLNQEQQNSSQTVHNTSTSTAKSKTARRNKKIFRILHVITSSSQYDDGQRNTTKRADRLVNQIIPALTESVKSMISINHWQVDVYLITGYNLKDFPRREQMIRRAMPEGVGLEIWSHAFPYSSNFIQEKERDIIWQRRIALSRQHRYVVKDKLHHYDLFSCWEDDLIIKAEHIQNYLDISNEIKRLHKLAPHRKPKNPSFYSILSKQELAFALPGFIRVEVLKDPENYPRVPTFTAAKKIIPANKHVVTTGINSTICCNIPSNNSLSVAIWETAIQGLSIKQFQNSFLNWTALLPCTHRRMKSYFPFGRNKAPIPTDPQLFAQQAGWMMTRDQLIFIDKHCPQGGFLPYFEPPHWRNDGLYSLYQSVEFWSGGYHLFGKCGVQRILSLDFEMFSKQLLFHVSNNKQFQRPSDRFVRANDLFGQLYTLKERAIADMKKSSNNYR